MGTLVFILVLSILVIVHEWGHFITAKKCGVRVEKFSLGFGPKVFSRESNGTEFLVSAIPLGGYVKMAGDDRSQCEGLPEEFFSQPAGKRALIVLMGPVINFIFAYLCFYFILTTGFPMLTTNIGTVMDGYPAQVAGLKEGDQIVKINGTETQNWDELQTAVRSSSGGPVHVDFLRDQNSLSVTIEPRNELGQTILGDDEQAWIIGVQPTEDIVLMRSGLGESFLKAGEQIASVTSLTLQAISRVVTGRIAAKDALAGPIRIHGLIDSAATMGFAYIVYIMAVISTSLAIFNLFPVPVLDGGHLFFIGIEKLRGQPLPLKVEEGITKVGFAMLMMLMVFVLYNDMVEVGWVAKVQGLVENIRPQ